MAPEKQQHIDRLIIINGKWNTPRKKDGEVVPTLIIGTHEAKKAHYDQFLEEIMVACERLDRVVESKSTDRILRLNLAIYDFPKDEKSRMEIEICKVITQSLPEVRECLFFTHSTDRERLEIEGCRLLKSSYKAVFHVYNKGDGVIYGDQGGIVGGAIYPNSNPGPSVWNSDGKYHCLTPERFEKVWDTYFYTPKDRILILRRTFRILQSYGATSWKQTRLGKKIGQEVKEFGEYITAELAILEGIDSPERKYLPIFQDIDKEWTHISRLIETLANGSHPDKKSWETINNNFNSWTKATL